MKIRNENPHTAFWTFNIGVAVSVLAAFYIVLHTEIFLREAVTGLAYVKKLFGGPGFAGSSSLVRAMETGMYFAFSYGLLFSMACALRESYDGLKNAVKITAGFQLLMILLLVLIEPSLGMNWQHLAAMISADLLAVLLIFRNQEYLF